MFKILLIEENTILRTGMKALFDEQPEFQLFAEAVSVREALTINPLGEIDLIITDISLTRQEFLSDMEALRSTFPEARILVFTSPANKKSALASLEEGASSYMFKDTSGEELVTAAKRLVVEANTAEASAAPAANLA